MDIPELSGVKEESCWHEDEDGRRERDGVEIEVVDLHPRLSGRDWPASSFLLASSSVLSTLGLKLLEA